MPRVPTYDNLQTRVDPGTQPSVGANGQQIVGEQIQRAGAAIGELGSSLGRIALDVQQQADQVRVSDAMNQAIAARLTLTHDKDQGFLALQGRAALDRPDGKALDQEYGEKLGKAVADISAGLGNDVQRREFMLQSGQMLAQFKGQVQTHMAQESKQYALSTQAGTVKVAQDQMALDWSNPEAVAQGQRAIKAAVAEAGRIQGWAPADILAHTVEALSPAHQAVATSMMQAGKLDAAGEYMKLVNAELTPTARLHLQEQLKLNDTAQQAQTYGAALAAKFDYLHTADAQKEIDAMDVPATMKAAIRAEVEHRHTVQQSDADKSNAVYVGKLDEMVQRGMSLAAIQRTPEFAAVRDKGTVLKLVRERTEHAVNLQAAQESRDWSRVQRLRAEDEYRGLVRSFPYSDPNVLSGMTREKVAGLVLELGPHNTSALLAKWDAYQADAAKLREAKIDQDQFNSISDSVGLPAYEKNKSPDQLRMLSVAKDRVEAGIALWQQAHPKQVMPREEKAKLMRNMLAEQLQTKGWLWGTNGTNVMEVPEKDVADIVVPKVDADQITARLRQVSGKPDYVPTQAEIARAYLMKKHRDAALR